MRRTQPRRVEPDVKRPTAEAPAPPRSWFRLFDGAHPWGSFDAAAGRYGVRRYRLLIYPPGTTALDRQLARIWRGWPLTGAALGLLAIMFLGNAVAPPITVLEYAVAAYVGVGALLFVRAGPARVQVRSLSAILLPNAADARERCRRAEWEDLVRTLTRADQMLTAGAISVVEHEAIWWGAYDRLGATTYG